MKVFMPLFPKKGSFEELVEQRARAKAVENVQAVEHTMSLEDQAVGGTDEKIEEHTKRILQRRRKPVSLVTTAIGNTPLSPEELAGLIPSLAPKKS